MEILNSLKNHRNGEKTAPPIITWEPIPDLCLPENLENCYKVLPNLNILTPNAEEAARFFGETEPVEKDALEELAARFLPHLTNESVFKTGSGIVLRCGKLGCLVKTSTGLSKWFSAYHQQTPNLVTDPTGGGNSFIGGFTTAFIMSKGDWEISAICGNLAAGIGIEQIGMPTFNPLQDSWNSLTLEQRIEKYLNSYKIDNFSTAEVMEKLNLR